MDEVIWVEVLSRHQRDVAARYRCTGDTIRIGRAYTNDVVLDDPYVAAEHIRIARGADGALVAEDLGSANGLHAGHGKERVERLIVGDDRPFRIGHTYLRIRRASQRVAPERLVERRLAGSWPAILATAALLLGIEAGSLWLTQTAEPTVSRYLLPLLGLAVFVTGWAALWAVMSRIFTGQAQFESNLIVALVGTLIAEIYAELTEFAAFALSWSAPVTYRYAGLWCIVAGVCFVELHRINPSRPALKGGIVAAALAFAIAGQTVLLLDEHAGFDRETYVRRLLPPSLRLAPLHSEASFFAGVEKLQGELDEDRNEEP